MTTQITQHIDSIDLYAHSLSSRCKNALEYKFVIKYECLIFAFGDENNTTSIANTQESVKSIFVAITNTKSPLQLIAAHISALYPHYTLRFFLASAESFAYFANQIKQDQTFRSLSSRLKAQHNASKQGKDSSALELLNFILLTAIQQNASDVHFEQVAQGAFVRIRIDGMLQTRFCLESSVFEALSARLKIECELDIAQIRKSQDGRFSRIFDNESFDFRLSCVPILGGESLVVRILHQQAQIRQLSTLGFSPTHLADIHRSISLSHGIILLTGPTGSGKSTTLYAMLNALKSPTKKIITLEDPIEYQMEFITQVQVHKKYEFGFSSALRALLRQDPDVLMIGEIRDEESLQIAIRASLTGHLVLATLHANDSVGAVDRMLEMGLPSYLLASSLNAIISQRLARTLCPHCKVPIDRESALLALYKIAPNHKKYLQNGTFYAPKGCARCNMQGFSGRILIPEVLSNSPMLTQYIKSLKHREKLLESTLEESAFESMFEYALKLYAAGHLCLEEIYRVCKI